MRDYVGIFGYGSLINSESASRTLRRTVHIAEFSTALLKDYKRTWNVEEDVFSDVLDKNIRAVFLSVEECFGAEANGVLLKVSLDDLELLKKREKNYNCVDVTQSIAVDEPDFAGQGHKVYTFAGKKECAVKGSDAYVMKRYLDMVESGCEKLGKDFMRLYHETTAPFDYEILDGTYTFVEYSQAQSV